MSFRESPNHYTFLPASLFLGFFFGPDVFHSVSMTSPCSRRYMIARSVSPLASCNATTVSYGKSQSSSLKEDGRFENHLSQDNTHHHFPIPPCPVAVNWWPIQAIHERTSRSRPVTSMICWHLAWTSGSSLLLLMSCAIRICSVVAYRNRMWEKTE